MINKKLFLGLIILLFSLYIASAAGCCFNSANGQCLRNAEEDSCISPGIFSLKPDCSSDTKCVIGCCIRENSGAMTTQRECDLLSDSVGVETNWNSGASEEECASVARQGEYGACLSGDYAPFKCRYKTAKECSSQYFYPGVSCTSPQLNTSCKKTSNSFCWPKTSGNDTGDVYTKDSCGNPDEKISSCDYSLGNVCKQTSATKAECKNLNCYDEKTKITRMNGESWCAYDSFEYFSYEKEKNWVLEPVGSRFARKYCLNGEIKTEACADYRGEYCDQGSCVANNWQECLSVDPYEDECADSVNHCAILNGHPGCGNPVYEPGIENAFCKMNGEEVNLETMSIEEVRAITGEENLQSATQLGSEFRPTLKTEILSDKEKKLKICFSTLAGGVSIAEQTKEGICSLGNYEAEIKFGVERLGGGDDESTIYYLKTDGDEEYGKYGWAGLFDLYPTHWTHKLVQITEARAMEGIMNLWWQPDEKDLIENRNEVSSSGDKLYCIGGNNLQTENPDPYSSGPFGCNFFNTEEDEAQFQVPIDPWIVEFLDWRCQNIGDCDGKLNWLGEKGTGKAEGSWDVSFNNSGNSSDGRIPDVIEWKYGFDNGAVLTFRTYATDDKWDNGVVITSAGNSIVAPVNLQMRHRRDENGGWSSAPAKFANDDHGTLLRYTSGEGETIELYSDGYKQRTDKTVMHTYTNLNNAKISLGTPISLQTKVIKYKTNVASSGIGTTDAEGNLQVMPGANLALTCTKNGDEITCPIEYTCAAWRAPSSGEDKCSKCGKDGIDCSDYRCKAIGRNCEYKSPEGADKGYCVATTDRTGPTITSKSYSPSSPLMPWTPMTIQIKTNEDSFCKFNMGYSGANYEDMKYDFSSGFGTEHSLTLTLPGKMTDEERTIKQYPLIQGGGKYDMFIRCQDLAGNYNTQASLINFEVMQTPEYVPAVIINFTPTSGSRIKYGETEKEIKFRLNEPATCKWGFADAVYSEMPNEFSCDNSISDSSSINGYWCSGKLKNITTNTKEQTKVYIRCKDNPQFEGKEDNLYKRNENPVGKEYTLRASEELIIDEVSPIGIRKIGSANVSVELRATTSKGAFNGQAICKWAIGNTENIANVPLVKFSTTGGSSQVQKLNSPKIGENFVKIRCEDSSGNIAEKNFSFTLEIDYSPPIIARIMEFTKMLKIKTIEDSTCYASFNRELKCLFDIANSTVLTGAEKEHTIEWKDDKTYYIKCRDYFGNEDSSCNKIIRTY